MSLFALAGPEIITMIYEVLQKNDKKSNKKLLFVYNSSLSSTEKCRASFLSSKQYVSLSNFGAFKKLYRKLQEVVADLGAGESSAINDLVTVFGDFCSNPSQA